jgi:Fe-S cluster biogenesis protein NfuA
VRLTGACQGCPMAQFTLQMGVERVLRNAVPELTAVEAVA